MDSAVKVNGNYESITFNSNSVQTIGKGTITLLAQIKDNEFAKFKLISKRNLVTILDVPKEVTLKLSSKKEFLYELPTKPR